MQNLKKRKFETSMYPGTPIRKYYPDRSSMRPKLSAPQLAQVKRVILNRKERKIAYGNVVADLPDYNGLIRQVTLPTQGNNGIQRIGDEIQNVYLEVRGSIQYVDNHVTRLIGFQWKSDNTTAPVPGDVLVAAFFGAFNSVNAAYNEDSQKKLKILFDRTIPCNVGQQVIPFKFYTKCLDIEFKQSSATNGTNCLYILQVQDGIATLNETYYVTTVHFTDA